MPVRINLDYKQKREAKKAMVALFDKIDPSLTEVAKVFGCKRSTIVQSLAKGCVSPRMADLAERKKLGKRAKLRPDIAKDDWARVLKSDSSRVKSIKAAKDKTARTAKRSKATRKAKKQTKVSKPVKKPAPKPVKKPAPKPVKKPQPAPAVVSTTENVQTVAAI